MNAIVFKLNESSHTMFPKTDLPKSLKTVGTKKADSLMLTNHSKKVDVAYTLHRFPNES